MEDTGEVDDMTDIEDFKLRQQQRVASSYLYIASNQRYTLTTIHELSVQFERIYVIIKITKVPANNVGCALVCCPNPVKHTFMVTSSICCFSKECSALRS